MVGGMFSIRGFAVTILLAAAILAAAGTIARATVAPADPAEWLDAGDTGVACAPFSPISPVNWSCLAMVEQDRTSVFVYGSAGVSVRDTQGHPVVSFSQPVGRTGAGLTGRPVPSVALDNREVVPGSVVCAPLAGCNDPVTAPGDAGVRVLPGGSTATVATAGGGGTLTVTETCVNTAGGCGTAGAKSAEVGTVTFSRS